MMGVTLRPEGITILVNRYPRVIPSFLCLRMGAPSYTWLCLLFLANLVGTRDGSPAGTGNVVRYEVEPGYPF